MLDSFPPDTSLVLVAVITSPDDLEIARVLGWYRIPIRSAPRLIAVDYLAFYQTSAFKEDKWQIKYIAPVMGHELTTRAELLQNQPNHPRADQEYFKIQLGSVTPLPEPIRAGKWRRITFFYTTGEYLSKAKKVNDLVVESNERKILWRALHERASLSQKYQAENIPEMQIDPAVLEELFSIRESPEDYR
jgi:hypothetical protein